MTSRDCYDGADLRNVDINSIDWNKKAPDRFSGGPFQDFWSSPYIRWKQCHSTSESDHVTSVILPPTILIEFTPLPDSRAYMLSFRHLCILTIFIASGFARITFSWKTNADHRLSASRSNNSYSPIKLVFDLYDRNYPPLSYSMSPELAYLEIWVVISVSYTLAIFLDDYPARKKSSMFVTDVLIHCYRYCPLLAA